jgi:GNAT superfamily N-acetyltransferase
VKRSLQYYESETHVKVDDTRNSKLAESKGDATDRSQLRLAVECVGLSGIGDAARVLAEAYVKDPVLVWSIPNALTRIAEAESLFKLILRSLGPDQRKVFATSDWAAVAVMVTPQVRRDGDLAQPRCLPGIRPSRSPVADYFGWIETLRPKVAHYYLEFIGCISMERSRGRGSILLGHLLERADREGIATWAWSSNSRNLAFYRRLGFEIGDELRHNVDMPAITPLWRLPVPVAASPTIASQGAS